VSEFKTALRYKPDYAEAHDYLGAAYYAGGRFAEAVAEFTETVRLKPDLAGARDNLELARRALGASARGRNTQ
jgi:tetratricopeptide (TPR) repeat protein